MRYYLPLENVVSHHLNLMPYRKGFFVQSLVEIWPIKCRKKDFLNFVNIFSLFRILLENEVVLHLKKKHKKTTNKHELSLAKHGLFQVWLK